MARLLRDQDYLRVIQNDNLQQVIEENRQIMLDVEQAGQAEMISYLVQRYYIPQIFTNTVVFSQSGIYGGKQLVYLDASAYSAVSTYLAGDLVLQAGNVYSSIAGNTPGSFDASQWMVLGVQYAWFNVKLPFPEFIYGNGYVSGDKVWYQGFVYTATQNNNNILPSSGGQWSTPTAYTISGVLPTDFTTWSPGDNRNQLIVLHLVNITLYHLHFRINPRLIPEHRKEAYNGNSPTDSGGAIGWLKRCGSGDVTADLPNITPQQGMSIRYGNASGLDSNGNYVLSNNAFW